jgi:hypothetical protein
MFVIHRLHTYLSDPSSRLAALSGFAVSPAVRAYASIFDTVTTTTGYAMFND